MLDRKSHKQTRLSNETAILRAAEKVFADAGYKGASISMIAAEAGVPKSNVVYYFGSKDKLYSRVIEDIYDLWLQASDMMDDTDNPVEALTSYIHDKMDLSRNRPDGSKVWANEIIQGAPFVRHYLEESLNQWMTSRKKILRRWMKEGHIKTMPPESIIYMIWSATQHYADFSCQIEALNGGTPMSDKQWNDAKASVTAIILNGIGIENS